MELYRTSDGYLVKKEKEMKIFESKMDNFDSDIMSDDWTQSDDFLESIFSSDLLKELDAPHDFSSESVSPISSVENDFNSFTEMNFNDIGLNFMDDTQPIISSSSSDSGLSSDHLDVDVSPDYEPLSPTLSSPGPSISERGGQNSPPRYILHKPVSQIKLEPSSPAQQHQQSQQTQSGPPPKVIVEKIDSSGDGNFLFNNGVELNGQPYPKIVKINRMPAHSTSTINNNNSTVQIPPAQQQNLDSSIGRKVTIQLKHQNTIGGINQTSLNKTQNITGTNKNTVIINKQGVAVGGVKKLIRVQNPTNPRSILLPVSLQDVKDFRTIKIVNASNYKTKPANIKMAAANLLQQSKKGLVQKNVLISRDQLIGTTTSTASEDSFSDHNGSDGESYVFEEVMKQTHNVIAAATSSTDQLQQHNNSDEYLDNDDDDDDDMDGNGSSADDASSIKGHVTPNGGYPKLMLTTEEKRLLAKEGISLPSNYPLTKHEERELKRIRRKIRNKISAQDSRKRKKEYVDGLEERVKQCTEENQTLLKRIKLLQTQNHNLMSQMKKLQSLLTKGTGKTAQPATCLMVLLLSMALVAVPNLKLGQNTKESEIVDAIQETITSSQQSRNLLYDTKEHFGDVLADEELNYDDIMAATGLSEHDYSTSSSSSSSLMEDDIFSGVKNCQSNAKHHQHQHGGGSTGSLLPMKKPKMLVDFDVDDVITTAHNEKKNQMFMEHATQFQENLKTLQSSGFNIENGDTNLLGDLLNDVGIGGGVGKSGEFELDINQMGTPNSGRGDNDVRVTASGSAFGNNKKNSSAQIKTRNLLVQDV